MNLQKKGYNDELRKDDTTMYLYQVHTREQSNEIRSLDGAVFSKAKWGQMVRTLSYISGVCYTGRSNHADIRDGQHFGISGSLSSSFLFHAVNLKPSDVVNSFYGH